MTVPERSLSAPPLRRLEIDFISLGRVPYAEALTLQRKLHEERLLGKRGDTVLFLEHPRVITKGRRPADQDFRVAPHLLKARGFAIEEGHRGGTLTYHGPGQLVVYFIVSLEARGVSIPLFVRKIETALVEALAGFGIEASPGEDEPGIWTRGRKIASLGLSVNRGVSMHGAALNISPDLRDFEVIVPCGIPNCPMTSMEVELGGKRSLTEVEEGLKAAIDRVFSMDS